MGKSRLKFTDAQCEDAAGWLPRHMMNGPEIHMRDIGRAAVHLGEQHSAARALRDRLVALAWLKPGPVRSGCESHYLLRTAAERRRYLAQLALQAVGGELEDDDDDNDDGGGSAPSGPTESNA